MATPTVANQQPPASFSPGVRSKDSNVLSSLPPITEQVDPLKVALSGFPDVNSYRAHYEGAEHESN